MSLGGSLNSNIIHAKSYSEELISALEYSIGNRKCQALFVVNVSWTQRCQGFKRPDLHKIHYEPAQLSVLRRGLVTLFKFQQMIWSFWSRFYKGMKPDWDMCNGEGERSYKLHELIQPLYFTDWSRSDVGVNSSRRRLNKQSQIFMHGSKAGQWNQTDVLRGNEGVYPPKLHTARGLGAFWQK